MARLPAILAVLKPQRRSDAALVFYALLAQFIHKRAVDSNQRSLDALAHDVQLFGTPANFYSRAFERQRSGALLTEKYREIVKPEADGW